MNKFAWKCNRNVKKINQENEFENVVWIAAAILSRPQNFNAKYCVCWQTILKLKRNPYIFLRQNTLENVVHEMVTILSRTHCVKSQWPWLALLPLRWKATSVCRQRLVSKEAAILFSNLLLKENAWFQTVTTMTIVETTLVNPSRWCDALLSARLSKDRLN